MTNYTVKVGDNLTKIAKQNNTTVVELVRINDIKNPNLIHVGQEIKLFDEEPVENIEQTTNETLLQNQEELTAEIANMQSQLEQMQDLINEQNATTQNQNELSELEIFGYGAAGATAGMLAFAGAKAAAPYVKSGAQSLYLKGLYAKDAIADGLVATKAKAGEAVRTGKNLIKRAEVRYACAKDAATKTAVQTARNTKAASIKGSRILNMGKSGKFLGKIATPLAVAASAVEITAAYKEGGTKAAVKQGAKCASGLACSAAGAKIGAAVGACTGPAAVVAVPVLTAVGAVAGYFGGEKLMGKVMSWFD